MRSSATWLDRAIVFLAPRVGLQRLRARMAADLLARHYEAAADGRRTQGWRRSSGDANAVIGSALIRLRENARDLVRNNGYAESALTTIGDHVVGWGIVAKPKVRNLRATELWEQWAGTTACDADGRNDFAGLQKLVMRTVVESGECLVRRRLRRPEDNLPIPVQLQVMDPDYLDTAKTGTGENGRRIVHGVEYDALGRRAAYWMFPQHPGAEQFVGVASKAIPAESVLHVYKQLRPGQVRGVSWFAPVMLRFKDFDEYEDATLMKQKIAACLAVLTSDVDGSSPGIGTVDESENPAIDSLEPGMILNVAPGRDITVVDPPRVAEYSEYSQVSLRAIATGLGVAYEDLTGDYTGMPFSAARMSRLRHWARVEDWRWRTLIPQFCAPAWSWAMQAAQIMGLADPPRAAWTAPPPPMIEPDKEGLAHSRRIRNGLASQSEVLRELGYDPKEVFKEMAADNKILDDLELILDSDPRNTTQAGNPTKSIGKGLAPQPEPAAKDEDAPPERPPAKRRRSK
jgi:lambda family phage portal protein